MSDKMRKILDGANECLMGAVVGIVLVLVVVNALGILGIIRF